MNVASKNPPMSRTSPLSLAFLAIMAACPPTPAPSGSQGEPGGPTPPADGSGAPPPPTTGETPPTSTAATTTLMMTTGGGSGSTAPDEATGSDSTGDATCGNGIVEPGEACDHGFLENKDTAACTTFCMLATCGDGFVQSVHAEECDDGPKNAAVPGYNQCSTSCTRGPHCGDGVVQYLDGEECEPSDSPEDTTNCAGMCVYSSRLVFLTSTSFSGDIDGLAGADKRCNELAASSPDLTGAYRAWLLVDGQSLADRFPEFSAENVGWNFRSTGNQLLAKSFQQLVSKGPAGPLAYTEHGAALPNARVWTNITAAGVAAGGDCGQWTEAAGSSALTGLGGFLPDQGPEAAQWHAEHWWTESTKKFCDLTHHLYCVQVSD